MNFGFGGSGRRTRLSGGCGRGVTITKVQFDGLEMSQNVKTSGQGGRDADGRIVPDVEKQVVIAFENIEKALKSIDSQLSWQNVYSVHTYQANLEETFAAVTANFKMAIRNHGPI